MFEALRTPKFPRNGLAIGEASVSVARSQSSGSRPSVNQFAEVALPQGRVNAFFTESNFDSGVLEDSILECADKAGLSDRKNWGLALPQGTARIATLALESEPKSTRELSEILEWKAGTAFGVDASHLRLSADRISNDVDGQIRYVVTAVCKGILSQYEELAAGLGWNVGLVLPRAMAESAVLAGAKSGDQLLLSFSSNGFNGMVMRGTDPLIVRNVNCSESEVADELYRLALYYSDRYGAEGKSLLSGVTTTGSRFDLHSLAEVCTEALGYELEVFTGDSFGVSSDLGASETALASIGVSSVGSS